MVTVYIPHSENCTTARALFSRIFGYICDGVDPDIGVLAVETDSKKNGHILRIYADGYMFCDGYVYDETGEIVKVFHWQGSYRLGNMTVDDFKKELQSYLDTFPQKHPSIPDFLVWRCSE